MRLVGRRGIGAVRLVGRRGYVRNRGSIGALRTVIVMIVEALRLCEACEACERVSSLGGGVYLSSDVRVVRSVEMCHV